MDSESRTEHPIYAGFWSRAAARIIDVVLILATFNLIYLADRLGSEAGMWPASGIEEGDIGDGLSLSNMLRALFYLAFPVFYYVYLHGSCGQTFGKMALRIKVINEDGSPLGYKKAFFRWLGYFLCDLTFNIGYVWAAFDPRKQGLHDKVCRTLVVRTDVPCADLGLPREQGAPPLDTQGKPSI